MRCRPYHAARPDIRDADLLLFRPTTPLGLLIARTGHGHYSHAGRACWALSRLLCADTTLRHGCRIVRLSDQAARYPGKIDVYRPTYSNDEIRRFRVVYLTFGLVGRQYGLRHLLAAGLRRAPLLRLLIPHPDDTNGAGRAAPELPIDHLPFCSELCALADNYGADLDTVPNCPAHLTGPNDLARSAHYHYLFTLT